LRYRGILEIDATRRSGGLPVELALTGRSLTVSTDDETLGTYPIDDIDVARVGSDRFDLRVGSEELLFTADDAIRFSYEAIPFIEAAHADRLVRTVDKVRSWWGAKTSTPQPVMKQEEPVPVELETVTSAGRAFSGARTGTSLSELRRRLGSMEDAPPALEGEPVVPEQVVEPPPTVSRSMSVDRSVGDAPREPYAGITCMGVRADGKVCGSAVVSERGFCFAHDPDRIAQRREIQQHTARAAERVRRASGQNLDDVVARLERAVAEVHEGRLDPQQALAMASLAHAMVETIELAKSKEPEATGT
jgi:hypothetical protein